MCDELMFSKTYRSEDDSSPYDLNDRPIKRRKMKYRKPSKKELIDALEIHNDGYLDLEDRPFNSVDGGE